MIGVSSGAGLVTVQIGDVGFRRRGDVGEPDRQGLRRVLPMTCDAAVWFASNAPPAPTSDRQHSAASAPLMIWQRTTSPTLTPGIAATSSAAVGSVSVRPRRSCRAR
jgi:hypothetical protein